MKLLSYIFAIINPLSAVGNYTVHGNLTFILSRVATHAPLCNTLPSNNLVVQNQCKSRRLMGYKKGYE